MTAEERVRACHEDMKKLMDIMKMPKTKAIREARKLWVQVRLREAECDFENAHADILDKEYYKHCCKSCKYRIQQFKRDRIGYCLIVEAAETNCGLVKKWLETRKGEH